jgi:hypothetical protein
VTMRFQYLLLLLVVTAGLLYFAMLGVLHR